jgi:hypothetical protein
MSQGTYTVNPTLCPGAGGDTLRGGFDPGRVAAAPGGDVAEAVGGGGAEPGGLADDVYVDRFLMSMRGSRGWGRIQLGARKEFKAVVSSRVKPPPP